MELDKQATQQLRDVQKRINNSWLKGTTEVLKERNPNLLSELDKLDSVMDSLLSLPSWPAPIRKQWNVVLTEYEKTAMQCVTYAKRHLPSTEQITQGV